MTLLNAPRERSRALLNANGGKALGAICGQLSQAVGSFALQLLAARLLGASGLGAFALVYSVILTSTAIGTGLVGDSLTILDRHRPTVRGALQSLGLFAPAACGVIAAVGAAVLGLFPWPEAILFGLAMAAFLIEDTMRRLLMASMRFWSLVVVDGMSLVVSLTVLGISAAFAPLSLKTFLLALLVGQIAAALVAVPLLPPQERHLAPWRVGAIGDVARFGLWRATQQAMRPTMLTVARILITIAVGRAVFGQLESARVYMAPALLLVQGIGSYLMSSYARTRDVPTSALARRADRASLVMLVGALVVGIAGTLAAPELGRLVTGSSYSMQPLAVFGWAVYAASSAAVMPFASLAAVRGRQSRVVLVRLIDSCLSVIFVSVLLFVTISDVSWSPFALAAGSFIGGAAIRSFVLKPLTRVESGADQSLTATGRVSPGEI